MSDGKRDPRFNPKVGDIVRGIWGSPGVHRGTSATLVVEAVCGNLVASSSDGGPDIRWQTINTWCQPDAWIIDWEILHIAE